MLCSCFLLLTSCELCQFANDLPDGTDEDTMNAAVTMGAAKIELGPLPGSGGSAGPGVDGGGGIAPPTACLRAISARTRSNSEIGPSSATAASLREPCFHIAIIGALGIGDCKQKTLAPI